MTVVHCGLIELDLLATHAGVDLPFPLRVPSFGRISGERDALLAAAGRTLRMRGLADDNGPIDGAAELVTALREHRGTVHLVVSDAQRSVAVVGMVYRSWALSFRQTLSEGQAAMVRIRRVPQSLLASELMAEVSDVPAVRTMPFTLSGAALRLIDDLHDPADEQALRDAVHAGGGNPETLDQLARLLPIVTGRGQVGATRDGAPAGTELSWLDGPQGRFRVDRDPDGGVSVNPLRRSSVRIAMEELAMIARRSSQ